MDAARWNNVKTAQKTSGRTRHSGTIQRSQKVHLFGPNQHGKATKSVVWNANRSGRQLECPLRKPRAPQTEREEVRPHNTAGAPCYRFCYRFALRAQPVRTLLQGLSLWRYEALLQPIISY